MASAASCIEEGASFSSYAEIATAATSDDSFLSQMLVCEYGVATTATAASPAVVNFFCFQFAA